MNICSSLTIGVLILGLVGTFGGESVKYVKGEVLEFGTYNVLARKDDVQNPTASGKQESPVHIVKTVEFLQHTNRVVARKGASFGFRYSLNSTRQPVHGPCQRKINAGLASRLLNQVKAQPTSN